MVTKVQNFVRERPVPAGLIALLLGAVIGLFLPESKAENDLFGEARRRLLDSRRSLSH